ncbi:MAG TPA: nuclear transport factor 2 family protein [Mycobacteriales bacterium]|jgi:hypothetical protein|nr:nuclear transport factor 2 family protein [Mycobacteriales bacterium]
MTSPDLTDHWELRLLVEHYCAAADRADGEAAAELFTEEGEFLMWLDPDLEDPTSHRRGRTEIAAALNRIRDYGATHHSIANSAVEILVDRAKGVTRCDAHHLIGAPPNIRDYTLYLSYIDDFERVDGRWLISRRELRVNWANTTRVERP